MASQVNKVLYGMEKEGRSRKEAPRTPQGRSPKPIWYKV